jgi:hypothetical protein
LLLEAGNAHGDGQWQQRRGTSDRRSQIAIADAMCLIEAEWRESRKKTAKHKRIIIEILGLGIKTIR